MVSGRSNGVARLHNVNSRLVFIRRGILFQEIQYYLCHTMSLWPEFIAEVTVGLSFGTHCAVSIDEFNELSHKISENRRNLKMLKCIEMWISI